MDYKEKVSQSGRSVTWLAKQVGISRVLLSYYINKSRSMPEHISKQLDPLLKTDLLTDQKA